MGCGCNNNCSGLGRLARAYGLRGLGALPVHLGAMFSLGVELSGWRDLESFTPDYDAIRDGLNASGYASNARVWKQAGWLNPYIEIEGRSGREYGNADHLRDAVLSILDAQGYRYDFGSIRFDVETYDPQTGAASSTGYTVRDNYGASSGGGGGGSFNDALDQFAGWLGMDRMTAAGVGAGAAIIALLLVKKVL